MQGRCRSVVEVGVSRGRGARRRGFYLQHRDLEGRLQFMQGGGCQAAAAAPDEAQGRGAVSGVVLTSPCQQHLYTRLLTVRKGAAESGRGRGGSRGAGGCWKGQGGRGVASRGPGVGSRGDMVEAGGGGGSPCMSKSNSRYSTVLEMAISPQQDLDVVLCWQCSQCGGCCKPMLHARLSACEGLRYRYSSDREGHRCIMQQQHSGLTNRFFTVRAARCQGECSDGSAIGVSATLQAVGGQGRGVGVV